MALHPVFPTSSYEPLAKVQTGPARGQAGASSTSSALPRWWFATDHLVKNAGRGDGACYDTVIVAQKTFDQHRQKAFAAPGSFTECEAYA